MKLITSFISRNIVSSIAAVLAMGVLLGLLWYRLGSLTYGNAANIEVNAQLSSATWQAIVANPLNAPYNVVHLLAVVMGYTGITSLRLTSTVFAVLAAVLFYVAARQWHNLRVALLATWLFTSSAWFLHVGRLGSPEILLLAGMLAIIVVLSPNKNGRHNRLALPSILLCLSIVLYVPGMVWLVVVGAYSQRQNIAEAWHVTQAAWMRVTSIAVSGMIIMPLLYAFVQTPKLIRQWAGVTQSIEFTISGFQIVAKNVLEVPKSFMYQSSFDAVHWLGKLPILNVFEMIMLILGIYFYATHFRAARTKLILIISIIAIFLIGVGSSNTISLIIPIVYLVAAAGMAYILHVWLKVFPNNPVARSLGILLITCTVVLSSVYHTRSYFVAWRYNTVTMQAFDQKL